jgi:hypothetical protein
MLNKRKKKQGALCGFIKSFYDSGSKFRYSTALLVGINTSLVSVWMVGLLKAMPLENSLSSQIAMIILSIYDDIYYVLDVIVKETLKNPFAIGVYAAEMLSQTGISITGLDENNENLTDTIVTVLNETKFWVRIVGRSSSEIAFYRPIRSSASAALLSA